ncbi:hypothetical protein SAMCFNEI73_Ch1015 [Sinorhizobium americanum]|uniref:Uncharacterized protein n=1 Tax=Sinorhizobium americanum TaxID=194963 RepID=A0A1L3LJW2_9HYPH|nr:hypothetical protein SAMCFNEI73_Ch1015 [Sinorhizobium americanum]
MNYLGYIGNNRKEGDPMSNEISDLVTGMGEVKESRQPSA